MATLSDHIRLTVLIDGQYQTTASNIQVNGNSGAQAVETLAGLAGKTPGSKRLEFTGNFAVPLGGPEFDFWSAVNKGTYHDIQIAIGAKSIVAKGWFQECGISQSTNANTEQTAHFIGNLQNPK